MGHHSAPLSVRVCMCSQCGTRTFRQRRPKRLSSRQPLEGVNVKQHRVQAIRACRHGLAGNGGRRSTHLCTTSHTQHSGGVKQTPAQALSHKLHAAKATASCKFAQLPGFSGAQSHSRDLIVSPIRMRSLRRCPIGRACLDALAFGPVLALCTVRPFSPVAPPAFAAMSYYGQQQQQPQQQGAYAASYPQQQPHYTYAQQPGGVAPGSHAVAPHYGAPQHGSPEYGAPQYGAPQQGAPPYGSAPYPQHASDGDDPEMGVHSPRSGKAGDARSSYRNFMDKAIRRGFIRKVYGLLTVQLAITTAITLLFSMNNDVKHFVQRSPGMLLSAWVLSLVLIIALACCPNVRRKYPINYIALFSFTLVKSYLVGVISSFYDTDIVLLALATTAAVTLALTVFAFQTKYDFTSMGGMLVAGLFVFIMFGFFSIFIRTPLVNVVYAALGVCGRARGDACGCLTPRRAVPCRAGPALLRLHRVRHAAHAGRQAQVFVVSGRIRLCRAQPVPVRAAVRRRRVPCPRSPAILRRAGTL